MQYLVGYELRNASPWALPLEQCGIELDLAKHREHVRERMHEETKVAREAQDMLSTGFELHPPQGAEVPEGMMEHLRTMVSSMAQKKVDTVGNAVDRWSDFMAMKLVVYWQGDYYFFREYTIVNSFEECLAWLEE